MAMLLHSGSVVQVPVAVVCLESHATVSLRLEFKVLLGIVAVSCP